MLFCLSAEVGDVGRVTGGACGAAGTQPAVPQGTGTVPLAPVWVSQHWLQVVAELPRATQHSHWFLASSLPYFSRSIPKWRLVRLPGMESGWHPGEGLRGGFLSRAHFPHWSCRIWSTLAMDPSKPGGPRVGGTY